MTLWSFPNRIHLTEWGLQQHTLIELYYNRHPVIPAGETGLSLMSAFTTCLSYWIKLLTDFYLLSVYKHPLLLMFSWCFSPLAHEELQHFQSTNKSNSNLKQEWNHALQLTPKSFSAWNKLNVWFSWKPLLVDSWGGRRSGWGPFTLSTLALN